MADFEINDGHRSEAEKLTGSLRQQFQNREFYRQSFARYSAEVAPGLPLRDVLSQMRAFSTEYTAAKEFGLPIPTASIPEIGEVPILSSPAHERFFPPFFSRRFYEEYFLKSAFDLWPEHEVKVVSPDQAREGFFAGLGKFLVHRIAGFDFWRRSADPNDGFSRKGTGAGRPTRPPGGTAPPGAPAGPIAPNGGLIVTLSCTNHYLRALASTAMAIQWHQFGSPTTPVTGTLLPGVWLFAADGGIFGSSMVIDTVPARIPPLLTPCATAF